jgi:PRTRC genetic system protein A
MFNVYLNNGDQIPDEQACYVIAKDGVYLKKNLGMIKSVTKVSQISFLETIKEQATLNIEKLPANYGAQVHEFFKDVCLEHHGSEAIVLLYYNQETKDYKMVAPEQIVAGGACDFVRKISMTMDGYNLVGDIHSHGRGSAFHSGTDDSDEKTGVDGLHITFGFVDQNEISISASITVNGKRFQVEPEQYLEGCIKPPEKVQTESPVKTFKMIGGKMVEQPPTKYTNFNSYLKNRYIFDVEDEDREYPAEWFLNVKYHRDVEKKTDYKDTNVASQISYGRWGGYFPGDYYDDFDSWEDYWNYQYEGIKHPLNVGPASCKTIGEGYVCDRCPYKRKALQIETGRLDEEVTEPTPDDGSAAWDPTIDEMVEDQLTNDDFLSAEPVQDDLDYRTEDEIPEEDLPSNLKGKPKSWIREWLGRLPS